MLSSCIPWKYHTSKFAERFAEWIVFNNRIEVSLQLFYQLRHHRQLTGNDIKNNVCMCVLHWILAWTDSLTWSAECWYSLRISRPPDLHRKPYTGIFQRSLSLLRNQTETKRLREHVGTETVPACLVRTGSWMTLKIPWSQYLYSSWPFNILTVCTMNVSWMSTEIKKVNIIFNRSFCKDFVCSFSFCTVFVVGMIE